MNKTFLVLLAGLAFAGVQTRGEVVMADVFARQGQGWGEGERDL